ncbi:conserved hypothetical protein [Thermobaculum terrenum ATCC BAA-798]|uniref:DUF4383 domain-containing protein n=1 Tax=Thermobaculum terrenum (strain ATCC BAA-798 / CCMEE 7001 / YNP1) TaxID=525904 RepID=D1CC61_THET1|nr:DUF4383 domain-containing protein [Thermobaculum terrenum]ACZ42376.1 conserved hypothetical protein [Thermobaculum terrenum ATCC BAA-798]
MAPVQTLALVFGIIYTIVGIAGFIPALITGNPPANALGPESLSGNLLGIFAINLYHSIAHLVIGLIGLGVYRNFSASRTYALVVGIIYALLFILGIIGVDFGGLIPMNMPDHILHLVTAVIFLVIYYQSARSAPATT